MRDRERRKGGERGRDGEREREGERERGREGEREREMGRESAVVEYSIYYQGSFIIVTIFGNVQRISFFLTNAPKSSLTKLIVVTNMY